MKHPPSIFHHHRKASIATFWLSLYRKLHRNPCKLMTSYSINLYTNLVNSCTKSSFVNLPLFCLLQQYLNYLKAYLLLINLLLQQEFGFLKYQVKFSNSFSINCCAACVFYLNFQLNLFFMTCYLFYVRFLPILLALYLVFMKREILNVQKLHFQLQPIQTFLQYFQPYHQFLILVSPLSIVIYDFFSVVTS